MVLRIYIRKRAYSCEKPLVLVASPSATEIVLLKMVLVDCIMMLLTNLHLFSRSIKQYLLVVPTTTTTDVYSTQHTSTWVSRSKIKLKSQSYHTKRNVHCSPVLTIPPISTKLISSFIIDAALQNHIRIWLTPLISIALQTPTTQREQK